VRTRRNAVRCFGEEGLRETVGILRGCREARKRVWYIAPMTRRELFAIAGLVPSAVADGNESILGNGWGLDHIEVAVADPKSASDMYATKLGFSVSPGVAMAPGVEHSAIWLVPAYVEFLWFGGAGEPDPAGANRILRRSVDEGGGIFQYNINVSAIQSVAETLRMRGFKVRLPPGRPRIVDGKETPPPFQFMFATEETPAPFGVPGGDGVGFIEYRNNSATRRPPVEHANTSQRLLSVWVAVADSAAAQTECERFGLKPLARRQSPGLGARGHEVECGLGSIVFWEPASQSGPVASRLKQKGPGPFGFSAGVSDLKKAHEVAAQGMQTNFTLDNGGGRKSFTVPGEFAGGVWVEFVEL
jgi:catechol 2,3-dioxygenase-like lactoylglutathione lyase family enzyme